MKVNYPTNMENSHTDFSDHFHNIKNFLQVDRRFKISKNRYIFPCLRLRKILGDRKFFQVAKMNVNKCQNIVLKFQ
jgi:hypothetical protein